MRLFEIEFTQSPEDIQDAIEVWRGYKSSNGSLRDDDDLVVDAIKNFSKPHLVKNIPISEIVIHNDWGRRVTSENLLTPIIVIAHPNGSYIVLDGQHRIITLKEKGVDEISASIVEFTWRKSMKVRGRQIYVIDNNINEDNTLELPDLEVGDELLVGKFKNKKAIIKGFTKDEHNQPVAKTNKGNQKIFKPRIKKLIDPK